MTGPLLFTPLYQERVWGGRSLETSLARKLPDGKVIGESWEIVDRPEAQSVVARGEHRGRTLRELVSAHPAEIMGAGWSAERPFPILVKWLDCQERLSLQVHPPASIAGRLGGEPKTENWYVADSAPTASLIVGLRRGATREDFERAIHDNTLEACVHRFAVQPGDSILVESGRLHAIDAGNLILEIQQNSDTTYRVYDWGRVGLDGRPRQLHVSQSMQCIDFTDFEPEPLRAAPGDRLLAACSEFRIRKIERGPGESFTVSDGTLQARLLHVVRGAVDIHSDHGADRFKGGDNVLLPAAGNFRVTTVSPTTLLLTDGFSGKSTT